MRRGRQRGDGGASPGGPARGEGDGGGDIKDKPRIGRRDGESLEINEDADHGLSKLTDEHTGGELPTL